MGEQANTRRAKKKEKERCKRAREEKIAEIEERCVEEGQRTSNNGKVERKDRKEMIVRWRQAGLAGKREKRRGASQS